MSNKTTVRPQFTHNETEAGITRWAPNGDRIDMLIDAENRLISWCGQFDGKYAGAEEAFPTGLTDMLVRLQERQT